jgi:hypothetical protein
MSNSFDAFELFGPFFDKPELFDNLFEPGYIIPVQLNKKVHHCTHDNKLRCIYCGASAFLRYIYFINLK